MVLEVGTGVKIKIGSILLIIAGIILLCYPKFSEMIEDAQQQKLAREWETSFQNIDSPNDTAVSGKQAPAKVESLSASNAKPAFKAPSDAEVKVEGMLTIDKINLKLPILHGATKQNMKSTVASIENTGEAGEIGNYAIAGHRNRTYGRNFNRLDELEKGDKIDVETEAGRFEYTVTEKLIVKPEDVWVLKGNGKDQEITLVTCHPIVNPTHRLIIKGKITNM
ncbi:class D sortase [Paenibacillus sp. KQZ6P-2]|uniref:Class D sortase n=1 Tax=Paenibacillus mangrovi TaxID=2931978 RepID=A0A9X1WYS6_9BACL|nr:class D sortase [Paenibacillus mangrovi]MCJ8014644.1 class D sortase [Paenibacillus mangrovi]